MFHFAVNKKNLMASRYDCELKNRSCMANK